MLEFIPVNDAQKENAKKSNSIAKSQSPFQHNLPFTVSGYDFVVAEIDGKVKENSYANPVLLTSVGNLFLSMLLKSKVDADGKILEPKGSFNLFVKETIAKMNDKSNAEILQAIVDGCKDKTLIVNRVPYILLNKFETRVPASLVEINFKD